MTYPAMSPVDYSSRDFPIATFNFTAGGALVVRRQSVGTVRVPPEQARTWRVTLGAPTPHEGFLTAFDFGSVPMLAIVTWGSDKGQQFTAEIDWSRGRSFCVHACVVNVDVQLAADAAVLPFAAKNAPRQFQVGCTIIPADDDGQSTPPPTRSIYTGAISAGAFVTLQVPAWSRAVRWYQTINTLAAGTPIAISLDGADDVAFTAVRQTAAVGVLTTAPPGFPVPGGSPDRGLPLEATVNFLAVTNLHAIETISLWLEFELDIG
jgi:hypothetical protein